jgi:predicted lipoprotein with Yx(FWY)xxD motif
MTRLRWLISITSICTVILAGIGAFTAAATANWGPTSGTMGSTSGTMGSSGGTMGSSGGTMGSSGGTEKITLENYKGGKILANAKGFTIYVFTRDTKNKDRCVRISGCKRSWPPVTTKGRPVAGTGVKESLLGMIKVSGVGEQVTYNGHPLYTYAGDGGPHQTFYVNFSMFGGHWPAMNPKGQEVK